jgi:hypothetical protein
MRPREHSQMEETELGSTGGKGTFPSVAPIGIVPKTSQDRKPLLKIFASRRDGSRAFAWATPSTRKDTGILFSKNKNIKEQFPIHERIRNCS